MTKMKIESSGSEVENLDTTEVEDARRLEIVQQMQPYKTRAGREVRRPKYLNDYVRWGKIIPYLYICNQGSLP